MVPFFCARARERRATTEIGLSAVKLTNLLQPLVEDLGYEFVGLEYNSNPKNAVLRIYIDHEDGIGIEDCEVVSRETAALLDVKDPIKSQYNLEVSSPGLDRPLKKPADFERFAGQKIKLKTLRMLDPDKRGKSRKTFTGELLGLSGDMIRIELDDKTGGQAMIALADLEKANLVEEF